MSSNNLPAVSVLIPAYNASRTISQALESLFRQTFKDFEIVVVDDGSTDDTPDILYQFQECDSRLRVISPGHQGIIGALNTGLSQCRGELLARMDADDISHFRRLELQTDFIKSNPEISVCSCRVRHFPFTDVQGGLKRYEQWLNELLSPEEIARDMFVESPVAHPSVMLRTRELMEIGGYQEHGWPEDYDLWLRYHLQGKNFAKLPRTLLFWRAGHERLTFSDSRYSLENFLRAKAHYLAIYLREKHPEIILWGAGMIGRRLSKHLVRDGVNITAVVDVDIKKIGKSMRGIPIFSPDYLVEHPEKFVLSAVGSLGARQLIRQFFSDLGRNEGRDFICVA